MVASCSAWIDADPTKLGASGSVQDAGPSGDCAQSCDDAIDCTVDECTADGTCKSRPSAEACDDGIGCTEDVCDPKLGCLHHEHDEGCEFCAPGSQCVAGKGCIGVTSLRSCNDNDPCTKDACVVAESACSSVALDEDGDGVPAAVVNGIRCDEGTDCDDTRASVFPGAEETCNGRDDNCNGTTDEKCAATPDNCAQPSAVTLNAQGSGTIQGTFAEAEHDFDPACGAGNTPDTVYRLDLKPGVLDIVIETSAHVVLAAGTSCDAQGFRLGCAKPLQSGRTRLTFHRFDTNRQGATLFILVDAADNNSESQEYQIAVKVSAATSDACGSTIIDHTGCGTLVGYMRTAQGALAGSCQLLSRIETEAVVRVAAQRDGKVDVRVSSEEFAPSLYALAECRQNADELECQPSQGGGSGEAAMSLDLGNAPAFVVVDSANATSAARYTLDCGP